MAKQTVKNETKKRAPQENPLISEKAAKLGFARAERVGLTPLTINEGDTVFLDISSENIEMFYSKKQDKDIPYINATNMETGETGVFWLSGGLNYNFKTIHEKRGTLTGLNVEITHLGKEEVEIDGETRYVNQYEMHILKKA